VTSNPNGSRDSSKMWLAGLLPHYFVRMLVYPDSEKDRLTQAIIPRPLREFHLADHNRFDPMATLHFGASQPLVPTASPSCREVKEGTCFDPAWSICGYWSANIRLQMRCWGILVLLRRYHAPRLKNCGNSLPKGRAETVMATLSMSNVAEAEHAFISFVLASLEQ
jgi:hypothetical protein